MVEAVASLGAAAYRNRGDRFLARTGIGGKPISFNNIRRMPRWWSMPEDYRDEIAIIACLLNFRQQIDQELDGNRLRALVSAAGENLFDAACSTQISLSPVNGISKQQLPIGNEVKLEGWKILHAALPIGVCDAIADARGDKNALELSDEAVALWQQSQAATQIEGSDA